MDKRTIISVAALTVGCWVSITAWSAGAKDDNAQLLKREEMLVLNLTRAPKSAHFYLLESLKATRRMEHDIEIAQHQVEQVDATFNKARGRAEERTMATTVERLKEALRTAQQLEQQLNACRDELKADVKQTLVR